jgi:tetratricopeptide (TPR) repeat protein
LFFAFDIRVTSAELTWENKSDLKQFFLNLAREFYEMKRVITSLFFILLLCSYPLAAQESEQDFHDAIKQVESLGDTLGISRAWYKLGRYYDQNELLDKSNLAMQKALFWAQLSEKNNAIAAVSNYMAANYSVLGRMDSAFKYYQIALSAVQKEGDSLKLAVILMNMSDDFATNAQFVQAVDYALKAIKIKEQARDSSNLAYFYQKVGEIYKQAGEFDNWERYVLKAYQLRECEDCADVKALAAIYNDLGGIAEKKQQYQLALHYYDTLTVIGMENEYPNAVGTALINNAQIYKLQGEVDKALQTAQEAITYRIDSPYKNIVTNNMLADLYLLKGSADDALMFGEQNLKIPEIANYPEEMMHTQKLLYKIAKAQKDFEKALYWHEAFELLSDSLRNKEVRSQILEMELAYETEKKEQRIALLTVENQLKNQRIKIGLVLLAVLLVIILLIIYILINRKKQAELKENNLKQQVLRAQMNPHFIFNVLGSIQNFVMNNEKNAAVSYLSQFASLTRATLNHSDGDSISLADEIEMLKNYIELEKMRIGNRFDYVLAIDENLEADIIQIPPMLVQPFIENAIKHGFVGIDYPGLLKVAIADQGDVIEFLIEDNGAGLGQKTAKSKTHVSRAMDIFNKRRKLIQQKYKKEFKFEMSNLKDHDPNLSGMKIVIHIPVLNDN